MTLASQFASGLRHEFGSFRSSPFPTVNAGLLWRTDFLNAGVTGADGLSFLAVATGVIQGLAGEAGHPGIFDHRVVAAGDGVLARASNAAGQLIGILLGGGPVYWEALVRIPLLSDGVDNTLFRVGLGDTNGVADEVDAVCIETDLSTNGSGNWFALTSSNSVRTRTNLGVAPVANAWARLRADIAADASSVTFSVNGIPLLTSAANIPKVTGRETSTWMSKGVKQLGATGRSLHIDYAEVGQTFTVAR